MQRKTSPMLGRYAPDFELPGTDGTVHHLSRYLERFRAIAIIFLSHGCPQSIQVLPQLGALQSEWGDRGFYLIAINANTTRQQAAEGLAPMATFAETHGVTFPYLRDVTQEVAQAFRASFTPEAFLLDHQGIVRYVGHAAEESLHAAAIALLQGQPLATPVPDPSTPELPSTPIHPIR